MMMSRKSHLLVIALIAPFATVLPRAVRAAIITGETATASSTVIFGTVDEVAAHAVDNSGLAGGDSSAVTADTTHTASEDTFMWVSSGTGTPGVDPDPTYTVNLGAVYTVEGVRIFNYNSTGFTTRGVQGTNLLYSATNTSTTPWTSSFTSLGSLTVPQASGLGTYTGTYFAFGSPVTAQYFQFDIQSNWGDGGSYYGFSELQFEQSVPEPAAASVLLLSAGIAALSRITTRKRRTAALPK
jgi:hypothetical protein